MGLKPINDIIKHVLENITLVVGEQIVVLGEEKAKPLRRLLSQLPERRW